MAITNKMRNQAKIQAHRILQQLRMAYCWLAQGKEFYGSMVSWNVAHNTLRIKLTSGEWISWKLGKLVCAELIAIGN